MSAKPERSAKIRLKGDGGAESPGPAIVLVEPQLGENIGAVARVMLNFGLHSLRIVNPRDGWPNEKAIAMSSGAAVIDKAEIFDDAALAIRDCSYVLAMTARPRESMIPVLAPEESAREIKQRIDAGARCAVLLGPERSGLANEDVMRADGIISIPVNPAFASLNLAQAAAVFAYEWARASGLAISPGDLDQALAAPREAFEGLIAHLFSDLETARYFYPPDKRDAMERKIRNALTRAGLTEGEVRMFRGMIKALAKGAAES